MDKYDIEPLEAASPLQKATPDGTPRPPLVPSEKNNANPGTRRPRVREVSSRYQSGFSSAPVSTPSTPRRSPSPITTCTSPAPGTLQPKRAQSAERKRPTTPTLRFSATLSPFSPLSTPSSPSSTRSTTPIRDTVKEVNNSARRSLSGRGPDGLWPSMRSLSSSFQSASISLPATRREKVAEDTLDERTKATTSAALERKRSPLRSRNTANRSESSRGLENLNTRVIDQHRWPAMLGGRRNGLSRSLDLSDKVKSVSSVAAPRGVSPKRIVSTESARSGLQQSTSEVATIDGTRRGECNLKSSANISYQTSERYSNSMQNGLSRSLDLTDKFNKSASSVVTPRGVSPRRTESISDSASSDLQQSINEVATILGINGTTTAELDLKSKASISSQTSERSSSAMTRSLDLTVRVTKSASSVMTPRGVSPKRIGSASDSTSSLVQQSTSEVARISAIDGTRRAECNLKSGTSISSQTSERYSNATQNSLSQSLDLSASSMVTPRGVSPKRTGSISDNASSVLQQSISEVATILGIDGTTRMVHDLKSGASISSQASESSSSAMSQSLDLTVRVTKSAPSVVTPRGVSPKRTGSIANSASSGLQQSISEVARILTIDGTRKAERDLKSCSNISSRTSERSSSAMQSSRTYSLPNSGSLRPSSPSRAISTPLSIYRGMLSPSLTRPSSPSQTIPSSPSRTMPSSPSRTRPSSPSQTRPSSPSSSIGTSRAGYSSSVFNYLVDAQKGKKSVNQIEDAHQLRLLFNANLQWRFINAQEDVIFSIQKMQIENLLYNIWSSISRLYHSVAVKKVNMHRLRREIKFNSLLEEQMPYLEHWATMEKEHSSCLSATVEALKASIIRLPLTRGARADAHPMKNSLSSAVDMMQAMGSSIGYLLHKVGDTEMLAKELSVVAETEFYMLDQCRRLLSSVTRIQVQEASLRAHLMQLKQKCS